MARRDDLKKELHKLGIKTYKHTVTQASYVKRTDVKKILSGLGKRAEEFRKLSEVESARSDDFKKLSEEKEAEGARSDDFRQERSDKQVGKEKAVKKWSPIVQKLYMKELKSFMDEELDKIQKKIKPGTSSSMISTRINNQALYDGISTRMTASEGDGAKLKSIMGDYDLMLGDFLKGNYINESRNNGRYGNDSTVIEDFVRLLRAEGFSCNGEVTQQHNITISW